MMKQGVIGVIVPIYKVEIYIAECIESILAQTYTNFRLILVDDGTPDNAGKICDEYAKKDSRITVIHQENAGVTRARARGVEEATDCEFIVFVDGDDTLQYHALKTLVKYCDNETDIILSIFDEGFRPNSENVSIDEFTQMLLLDNSMCVATWGKIYRRSMFSEYVFDIPRHITLSEDIIMNLRLIYNKKPKIRAIKERFYNYRANIESAANTFKTSPEYEAELFNLKMEAIPANQREYYRPFTIQRRVSSWRKMYRYNYSCKGMKNSEFYKQLKNDIEIHRFKLNRIEHFLFYNSNAFLRFFVINFGKIQTKISQLF